MRKAVPTIVVSLLTTLAALTPSAALAVNPNVLTREALAGLEMPVGDQVETELNAKAGPELFLGTTEAGATGVKCTSSSILGKVTANPESGGVPKAADIEVIIEAVKSCTTNIMGITAIESVTMDNLPYNLAISDAAGFPLSIHNPSGEVQMTIKASAPLGKVTCVYQAKEIKGSFANAEHTLTFNKQKMERIAGGVPCPFNLWERVTYGPLEDFTNGGAVFVN